MLQVNDTLMLASEAGRLLDVSAATIRVWEKTGRLPAIRTAGGVRLFAASAIERLKHERAAIQNISATAAVAAR